MTMQPCTCHPDDNPPVPCPQKFALTECRIAAAHRAGQEAMRERAAKEVVNCTDFAHEERDIWMQETIASAVRALSLEEQT